MNKQKLLIKIDHAIQYTEEKGIDDYYNFYMKLLDEAEMVDEEVKRICRESIQLLIDDSTKHWKMLERLKAEVMDNEREDY